MKVEGNNNLLKTKRNKMMAEIHNTLKNEKKVKHGLENESDTSKNV